MKKLRQSLLNHKLAILLAIVISIITAFPQVYFRIEHRNDGIYQGIELLPDSPWSPRAREVQDGHPNFGNIYNKDGKDNPYLFQPLGSMVVGYMGKIFSLDINNTILLSRLVLPIVTFLLIYSFVFFMSRDKFAALCSAAVLLLADSALSYFGIKQLLHGVSADNFLRMARPVNPAMIYIFFFGFLTSFWLFYKKLDQRWLYGIISTVLLGLNFYNYFYSWTYLYAFGGILVLILLIQKKWKEALKITSVFLGALLIAVPYVINLYNASLFPSYEEVGQRLGIIFTHGPLFVGFTVIIALGVFLLGFPKEDKKRYFFGLALLLTPFITMNQQVITGRVMQSNHYHWFFHKPIAVIFVLIVIFHLLTLFKSRFYKEMLVTLIIISSVFIAVFTQVYSYSYDNRDGGQIAIERQKYGPVMEWLNKNAEKEAVVFGSNETSHLTVIYTPLNVLFHRALCCTTLSATKSRVLDILFLFYRLRGVEGESVLEVFTNERKIVSTQIYGIYYRKLMGSYEAIPDEKIEEIAELYKETLFIPTSEWLRQILTQYEVEYIVWDKENDPDWQLEKYSFLKEVAVFNDIVIYQFYKDK
jgi:hypothetical protein